MDEKMKPEENLVPTFSEAGEESVVSGPAGGEEAITLPPAEEPTTPEPVTLEALQQELEALRARLEEAEQRNTDYLKARQQTEAAFASYRRRIEAEKAEWTWQANARMLAALLPLVDDFERAYQTMPQALQTLSWTGGLWLIRRKLEWFLETEGVKPIPVTPGQAFDPYQHEAALREPSATIPEGHIVNEIQRGYIWNERVVLRPALVSVAVPEGAPTEAPESNSGEETA